MRFSGTLLAILWLASASAQSEVVERSHAVVFGEPGRYGGWPANHGAWQWGDEVVVGFQACWFKHADKDHAIDRSKPFEHWQARSLDGGRTWKTENDLPFREEAKEVRPSPLDASLDFTAPGFALMFRFGSMHVGPSWFYVSTDRCHTWKGPYALVVEGVDKIAARTDLVVLGPRDALMFGSAAKSDDKEGRVFCARTRDGGLHWALVSLVGPEPKEGFAIMPSTVRLPGGALVTAIRNGKPDNDITVWRSDDEGRSWRSLGPATGDIGGNPPALVLLPDGRLCLTYGYRRKPCGIRAKLSGDEGRSWGAELILRDDGPTGDLGYPRSVVRPDGRVLTAYYFNGPRDEDRTIQATLWTPPERSARGEARASDRRDISFGGGPCSLIVNFRVDDFPPTDAPDWGDDSPMTVVRLDGKVPGAPVLFARVNRRGVFVTLFDKNNGRAGYELSADQPLREKVWHQLAVTDSGREMNLYLDGAPLAYVWHKAALPEFVRLQAGADGGHRRLRGEVGEVVALPGSCLEEKAVAARAAASGFTLAVETEKSVPESACRPLGVGDDVVHPLAGQLSVCVDAVAWCDAKGRDLLVRGEGVFGSRLMLHRFLETRNGLPVYDAGSNVLGFAFTRFQSCPNAAGTFDLYANGEGTRFGKTQLVCYRNKGAPGRPAFLPPQRVLFDGSPLPASASGGAAGWVLADIDGDGTADFVFARVHSLGGDTKFPFEGSPWTGKAQRYAGAGRGYDIRGQWLGADTLNEVFWAKGVSAADGVLAFGKPRQVLTRQGDYPLVWKTVGTLRTLAVETIGGVRVLLMAGNVDELVAVEVETRSGEIACGEARPLLRTGFKLRDTYYPIRIRSVDLDGDGAREILLDGNPGVVAVLKGRCVGGFEEVGQAQMRGGPVAVETLASPCRLDWDGDGSPDLITGDASGKLLFWPGTRDPWIYGAPQAMTVGGAPVKVEAGPSGSMQGPTERRWGYLKVAAGEWGGAPALITDDITGQLMLYRPERGAALRPGRPFTRGGQPYRVAWRSRPALIAKKTRFAGVPHDALVVQDWDGDLACAIPREEGGTEIGDVVKLTDTDGTAIRLCGPAGLWGRGAVALVDWDGDGNLDLIFGTNRSCQPFFSESMKREEATPFLLRNEGTTCGPRFAHPVPLRLKDGSVLRLGVHNATPWLTDLGGDARPDLLIGAENGLICGFLREAWAD